MSVMTGTRGNREMENPVAMREYSRKDGTEVRAHN
jgi:hypothetical protein